ncbi:hypothetical protein ERO13_A05G079700v2 [Gossypium hirsutum]|nr:hypothetical protein ES319_A05G083600v1 [Gossypium barbadense]KAG4198346.1 hypothetical protein ERO13_A05G079700v2 [Gossypium hirsutum]TYH16022.1 hypothetical protein ES288_A05G085800v1 [Gossypium darwinii]
MPSPIILHTLKKNTHLTLCWLTKIKMALPLGMISALVLFLVALTRVQLSNCQHLNAKISCFDCPHNYDFSGIQVAVKCEKVKKLATATTEENGSFKVQLPSGISNPNCLAKLLGGPNQLYSKKKNLVSKVVKVGHQLNTYTLSTPLAFSTSCPLASVDAKSCGAQKGIGSSKTVDLPLPPEWGLAPSSYYVPFFPIIGIP